MKRVFLASLALAGVSSLHAAPINVPGDQATIQAAINAAANGDEIIVAAGTYAEGLLVEDKSITIRGASAANRPIIVLSQNGSSAHQTITAATGLMIAGDGITVTIQDLILIPATTNTPARLVQTTTKTNDATITANFTNLLLAPNNGSNSPSVTDPLDATTALGTSWTSDGMYLVNRAFLATLRDAIGIYTLTDVTIIGSGRDGIVCYPNGTGSSMTVGGLKIARSTRNYIQWGNDSAAVAEGNDFTITGSRANPGLLVANHANQGSGNTVQGINGYRHINIDHLVFINNADPFIISAGEGVGASPSINISDSLFANTNGDDGLALMTSGTGAPTVTIEDNTFYGNGTVTGSFAGLWIQAVEPTYIVRNNIFAASGADQGGMILSSNTGPKVSVTNNAFVTAGPNALTATISGAGIPPAAETGTVFADPQFSSTTIATLADLTTAFDVTNSDDYYSASSTNAELNGWGDGPDAPTAPTDAKSWSLYN